jgi:hypothetical protein
VQDPHTRGEAVVAVGELNQHRAVRENLDANPECATNLAVLRDKPTSLLFFPHPLLALLLERTVKAVENVPPLAFSAGD